MTPMPKTLISQAQLRKQLRQFDRSALHAMLGRALEQLSDEQLCTVVADYLRPEDLRPDDDEPTTFAGEVLDFHQRSVRGEYYESFDYNSRNYHGQSAGTAGFIAEFTRLLERCVVASNSGAEASAEFALLFDLMDKIDECNDDIVFFADEGGAWQLYVDWRVVVPAWCTCLAKTTTAQGFADAVLNLIQNHARCQRDELVAVAASVGTPEQRAALAARG